MNVTCGECQSVFRIDPAKVPPVGVRARCSVCGGVFAVDGAAALRDAEGASSPALATTPSAPAAAPATPRVAGSAQTPAMSLTPPSSTPAVPAAPPTSAPPTAPFVASSAASATPVAAGPVVPAAASTAPAAPTEAETAPTERVAEESERVVPIWTSPGAVPAVRFGPGGRDAAAEGTRPSGAVQEPSTAVGSASAPAPTAPTAPPAAEAPRRPVNPYLANDPHAKARRLARALVSDIVAYHPQKREEGLRAGTLKQLFRDEIRKSYDEYVEQVGQALAESTPHFQDALNDVLAGGRKVF